LVVRLEDGKVYDCAGAIGTDALPAAELPIVLNGRILVPTSEGWACLASLQP
jgi:hypothetical protein